MGKGNKRKNQGETVAVVQDTFSVSSSVPTSSSENRPPDPNLDGRSHPSLSLDQGTSPAPSASSTAAIPSDSLSRFSDLSDLTPLPSASSVQQIAGRDIDDTVPRPRREPSVSFADAGKTIFYDSSSPPSISLNQAGKLPQVSVDSDPNVSAQDRADDAEGIDDPTMQQALLDSVKSPTTVPPSSSSPSVDASSRLTPSQSRIVSNLYNRIASGTVTHGEIEATLWECMQQLGQEANLMRPLNNITVA